MRPVRPKRVTAAQYSASQAGLASWDREAGAQRAEAAQLRAKKLCGARMAAGGDQEFMQLVRRRDAAATRQRAPARFYACSAASPRAERAEWRPSAPPELLPSGRTGGRHTRVCVAPRAAHARAPCGFMCMLFVFFRKDSRTAMMTAQGARNRAEQLGTAG